MGLVPEPGSGHKKLCWALIFTACFSRHCFVWLSFRQSTEAVIAGFEAAWGFFGGVFKVVIPDNMATVVDKADPIGPRLNQAFVEYAQSRGFVVDPARVRKPTDKPRVERVVPFVRGSFFAGENFIDLADAQKRAEQWCRQRAGQRVHGLRRLVRPRSLPKPKRPACSQLRCCLTTCPSSPIPRSTGTTT
jgi:transposase